MRSNRAFLLGNIEYIVLRMVRRFLFPRALRGIGRYVPYYRVNVSESNPEQTCRLYTDWLATTGWSVAGRNVVEIGSGATNGAAYALICSGAAHVWCIEPHSSFDHRRDQALLERVARLHDREPKEIAGAVSRCNSLRSVGLAKAHIVLSHSVLEHVSDLPRLCSEMNAALSDRGAMLHLVDYRDHFFKYPLHFLQFSEKNWKRFLDPGDLPRWRLSTHKQELERAGFHVRVLQQEADPRALELIKPYISRDFDIGDESLGVIHAVLYCERATAADTLTCPAFPGEVD
jgi:hypothetical protein